MAGQYRDVLSRAIESIALVSLTCRHRKLFFRDTIRCNTKIQHKIEYLCHNFIVFQEGSNMPAARVEPKSAVTRRLLQISADLSCEFSPSRAAVRLGAGAGKCLGSSSVGLRL